MSYVSSHGAWNTLWAAVPLLLALLALRPVSQRQLYVFADRYSVAPASITPAVARLVLRNRVSRLVGAALGFSLPGLCLLAGFDVGAGVGFLTGVSGYLIGAFVAAVLPTGDAGRQPRASLVPRRASDYLPRVAVVTPFVAVAASVAASVVYLVEPRSAFPSYSGDLVPGLVEALVAGVATIVAVRIVVARPQPIDTPELAALDDALRSQAVHTLTGAGLAVALLGAGSCLLTMGGYATITWLHVGGAVGGVVAVVAALVSWFSRTAPWRITRSVAP